MCSKHLFNPLSLNLMLRFVLGGPDSWDVLMAVGLQREAEERDAAPGCVLRRAAQSSGENVPKTKVHQQTRPEKTRHQTWS